MADPDPAEDASNLRLNRRRAVILRWWLLAAVAIAVSSAPTLLDIALPRVPMFAVLALMAGFNAFLEWRARTREAVGAGELFGELCVDLAALAILLYLSGGAANPLISFLLVPVAVAALSLPGALTAAVAMLAVALYTLLMWQFLPLAVGDAERATRLHLAGMWLTFVVSAAMIAWFVARMTASIRERDSRLAPRASRPCATSAWWRWGRWLPAPRMNWARRWRRLPCWSANWSTIPPSMPMRAQTWRWCATRSSCARASSAAWRNAAARRARNRCRHRMRATGCAACGALAGDAATGQPAIHVAGRWRVPHAIATDPALEQAVPTCSTMRPMPRPARFASN
jgi:hypothetical protein